MQTTGPNKIAKNVIEVKLFGVATIKNLNAINVLDRFLLVFCSPIIKQKIAKLFATLD